MTDTIAALRGIDVASFNNEVDRKAAVKEIHALLARIESPWDTGIRLVLSIPTAIACVKVCLDLDLFEAWLNLNGGTATEPKGLEKLVQCEPELLNRILRHLAASNILLLDNEGRYSMGPFAYSIVKEDLASFIEYYFMPLHMDTLKHLPTFLRKTGYKDPKSMEEVCFDDLMGKSLFQWMGDDADAGLWLARYFKAFGSHRGTFSAIASCQEIGLTTGNTDKVLIVDVGGGIGHDLQAFKSKHPKAHGKLVLQDLPDVVANVAGLDSSIEVMAHDFFTEQPVKGWFRLRTSDMLADAGQVLEHIICIQFCM